MNDEPNLIAGMEQIPQEMAARGAYADWLEEHGREEEAKFLRLVEMTGDEFQRSIVGQKDDEDYQEDGWVVCRVKRGDNFYGLVTRYGHCSCYDTWASICGGGISDYYPSEQTMQPIFDWVGTWDGLLRLAREGVNPRTGKPISESVDDWECRWLKETYEQVLATNG